MHVLLFLIHRTLSCTSISGLVERSPILSQNWDLGLMRIGPFHRFFLSLRHCEALTGCATASQPSNSRTSMDFWYGSGNDDYQTACGVRMEQHLQHTSGPGVVGFLIPEVGHNPFVAANLHCFRRLHQRQILALRNPDVANRQILIVLPFLIIHIYTFTSNLVLINIHISIVVRTSSARLTPLQVQLRLPTSVDWLFRAKD